MMSEREDRARVALGAVCAARGYNEAASFFLEAADPYEVAACIAFANAELSIAAQIADDEVKDIERHAHLASDSWQSGRADMARVIRDGILGLKDEK